MPEIILRPRSTTLEKKDLVVIESLSATKFPEYVRFRDSFAGEAVAIHEALQKFEHLIPADQLGIVRQWYATQTDTLTLDADLIHDIDSNAGWDEDALVENPDTGKNELITRHVTPTDVVRSMERLSDPESPAINKSYKSKIIAQSKKLTKKLESDPNVRPTLDKALTRTQLSATELRNIGEFLQWYGATEILPDDTNNTKLLRQELGHALELVQITPSGFAQGEEKDIAVVREVMRRIQNAGEEHRLRAEAMHHLKMVKLQLARGFSELNKTFQAYQHVHGVKRFTAEQQQELQAAMTEYSAELQSTTRKIDDILERNHLIDLNFEVLEKELTRGVIEARDRLMDAIEKAYRVTLEKPAPTLPQRSVSKGLLSEKSPEKLSDNLKYPVTLYTEAAEKELRELLGKDYFGPKEIKQVFGIDLAHDKVPVIPFTGQELEAARKDGMMLMLFVDKDAQGNPLSAKRMQEITAPLYKADKKKGKLLYSEEGWHKDEAFYTTEAPSLAWKLVSKGTLPDSAGKTYAQQTKELRNHLQQKNSLNADELAECSDELLDELDRLAKTDRWKEAAERLSSLKINQNHRLSFAEEMQKIVLVFSGRGIRLLGSMYSWTKSRSSRGRLVYVGDAAAEGADVDNWSPGSAGDALALSFSR